MVYACAASAGIHAALVPAHLSEAPALGVSFALAAVLLMAAAAVLAAHPAGEPAPQLAAVLLAALIAGWAVTRISAVPLLVPHAEAVDATGLVTKVIEALGLMSAIWMSQPAAGARRPRFEEEPR